MTELSAILSEEEFAKEMDALSVQNASEIWLIKSAAMRHYSAALARIMELERNLSRLVNSSDAAERRSEDWRDLYERLTGNDLMTIIDFCNEMAIDIKPHYSIMLRAIEDAHDLAHVLLGGDRIRSWRYLEVVLQAQPEYNPTATWPDVRLRMAEVFHRATAKV